MNDLPTLESAFPEFPFAKDADAFLNVARDQRWSIAKQLHERAVVVVRQEELLSSAGLMLCGDKFGIAISDLEPEDTWAEELGHEVGHTMHHDVKKSPPVNLIPEAHEDDAVYERMEAFCREFAVRWTAVNGTARITACMRNSFKMIPGTLFWHE